MPTYPPLLRVPGRGSAIWFHLHLHRVSTRASKYCEVHSSPVSLSFTFLHGPHHTYWLGRSLYEGGISSRGPSFGRATHTHKLDTQVLGSLSGSGQGLLATIPFLPVYCYSLPWFGWCFPAMGQRVKDIGSHFIKKWPLNVTHKEAEKFNVSLLLMIWTAEKVKFCYM